MKTAASGIFAAIAFLALLVGCGKNDHQVHLTTEEAAPKVQTHVIDTRPNAAVECKQIYAMVDQSLKDLIANSFLDTPPSQKDSALLAARQDLIKDLISATKIERWDSGIDFSTMDFETLLPYLGESRTLAKLLHADAHRFAQQPSGQSGCVDRLAAILRLGQHVGNEPVILSKLVSYSCFTLATQSTRAWETRFNQPEVKLRLREALEAARNSAAFDIRPVFQIEFEVVKRSIERSSESIMIIEVPIPITEAEKPQLIAEIQRLMNQIEEVCTAPDAEQRIEAIVDDARVIKAKAFMGGYSTLPKSMRRIQSELDGAIASLR